MTTRQYLELRAELCNLRASTHMGLAQAMATVAGLAISLGKWLWVAVGMFSCGLLLLSARRWKKIADQWSKIG